MEFLIIAVLAVWAIFALRSIKKHGADCGGDCANCGKKCNKCSNKGDS